MEKAPKMTYSSVVAAAVCASLLVHYENVAIVNASAVGVAGAGLIADAWDLVGGAGGGVGWGEFVEDVVTQRVILESHGESVVVGPDELIGSSSVGVDVVVVVANDVPGVVVVGDGFAFVDDGPVAHRAALLVLNSGEALVHASSFVHQDEVIAAAAFDADIIDNIISRGQGCPGCPGFQLAHNMVTYTK